MHYYISPQRTVCIKKSIAQTLSNIILDSMALMRGRWELFQ